MHKILSEIALFCGPWLGDFAMTSVTKNKLASGHGNG
jgi:hypothetical protein